MGDSGWEKSCLLLNYCNCVLRNNPVLIQAFTTITAVHSGTEKPKEKRCKQNPSGELVSVFQALVLFRPVPLGQQQSGIIRGWPNAFSQPSQAVRHDTEP